MIQYPLGPQNLFKLWFGFRQPVGRRAYVTSGFFLMAIKFLGDALLVYQQLGELLSPSFYLSPFLSHRAMVFDYSMLSLALAVWAIPFVWIGASMTARRAVNAGLSPLLALLFFVPAVNFVLMLSLCFADLPERKRELKEGSLKDYKLLPSLKVEIATAVGVSSILGIATLFVALGAANTTYGPGLFLGAPFAMGFVAAFLYERRQEKTFVSTAAVVQLSILITGGFFLLAGLEGALCLAMAYPLAAVLAAIGGALGRVMARSGHLSPASFTWVLVLTPLTPMLEPTPSEGSRSPLREVVTTIEIDAPAERIWPHLVAFSELPPPNELAFRLGIAHPRRAYIEGSGVGAVRYCEFSTGAFVEPITRWDEPTRLSFDVADQPPTMEEWSPYRITPPHVLEGLYSRRGEFRLVQIGPHRTRLEGSTWYELELYPQAYWTLWSDALIHGIHRQVLSHIRTLSERGEVAVASAEEHWNGATP